MPRERDGGVSAVPGMPAAADGRLVSPDIRDVYEQIYRCDGAPGRKAVSFDAQCDLAAVVYGADDDPDRLISGFAADLRRSGCRPVGVVQFGRSCRSDDPGLGVTLLPDGEIIGLALVDEPASGGCRLDRDRLAGLSMRLAAAIDDGADLVIINRFGRSEAEGGGLIDLIRQALDADIPVLIAVPEQRFAAWIRFSEGMNVRLACRRDALDRWWRTIAGVPRNGVTAGTFCEVAK
jgi:Protein of unknown function (DUF2478)